MQIISSKINMRLIDKSIDPLEEIKTREFGKWVLNIGEGKIPTRIVYENEECHPGYIRDDIRIKLSDDPILNIIQSMYPNIDKNCMRDKYLRDRSILTRTNDWANEVTSRILDTIQTEEQVYTHLHSLSKLTKDELAKETPYPV